MANPVADLSYRGYSGELEPPAYRWWAIAKAAMTLNLKKKSFWVLGVLSGYFYAVLMIVFYFVQSFTANVPLGQKNPIFERIVWKDQFLNAFSMSQLALFIIALLIGAGTIANDSRANALLVYLSKPVSRLDYLIGKWVSIFVPITIVSAVPTFVFYFYCFMSYREYGFLTEDPWLIVRLLGMVLLPGTFHASVALGISSMFKQGRLAGATYAGIFFMALFFTKAMEVAFNVMSVKGQPIGSLVPTLYYCSIDGMQIGLAKILLGTSGSGLFASLISGGPGGAGRADYPIPAPGAFAFVFAYFAICGLSLLVAWSRIKAVEVIA